MIFPNRLFARGLNCAARRRLRGGLPRTSGVVTTLGSHKYLVCTGVENKPTVGNLRAVKLLARWIGTADNAIGFVRISFADRVASSLGRRILFRGFRRGNWRCHHGASGSLLRPRSSTCAGANTRLGLRPISFTSSTCQDCARENQSKPAHRQSRNNCDQFRLHIRYLVFVTKSQTDARRGKFKEF